MDIIGIAAVSLDGFIARHSLERVSWTKDLSLFKDQTWGHTVVMGFNTQKTLKKHLKGRHTITVKRKDSPGEILKKINKKKCFIIGGGNTFSMFADHLTHLYITPHPLIFGKGIKLFETYEKEIKLKYEKNIPVFPEKGIFQYQFKISH